MKYLFINSVAGFGSTGRIAAEKCRELMKEGHECVLAFGRDRANCDDIPTVQIGTSLDFKLHGIRNRLLDDHGFGSKSATRKFLNWVRKYDPDVIWLHNIHGYYIHIGLLFGYLRTCGKKIIWTLHDCWAFTGHCAYFDYAGCGKWKSGCCDCPQKGSYPASLFRDNSRSNYEKKKQLFTGIPNVTLIVPSHWLESRVKQSFLKDYPVEVVYNTINREIFRPTSGGFREKYGLEGKKVLLGVASVWDERKGLKDFLALSELLDETYKIVLIGLAPEQIAALPPNILGLPRTNSMEELARAYTAADIFLNPSTEETFGMTAMEARSCGTEAIVYQDTACEEIVNQFGGIAVPRGAEHLYAAVLKLTKEEKK
ncbi:MAG: glycosyltransferase [Oscillospiraceae bacterium]|nr:glycosyltransferase [Oscillospiraceae bacterium]